MRLKITDKFESFYFIGIGGVSMSGLAKYLLAVGKRVGGTDVVSNEYTAELKNYGCDICINCPPDVIDRYDIIVYTDAVKDNNEYLVRAQSFNKQIISRGQLLYEISRDFKKVIAVSGCHGKTTCCAMITHIFSAAGKKFASHIGGKDLTFSNFYCNGNDFFITEACEYKKNFLLLKPEVAVILNSDADHLECYGSETALKQAYVCFAESADVAVTLYFDLPVEATRTFGFDKSADYYAKNIKSCNGKFAFDFYEGGNALGGICLQTYGKHNVLNAVAAGAVARICGIPYEYIRDGLSAFCGVERRFENIGKFNGVVCIADYAHHPSEIRAVIRTAQKLTSGKIFTVFQPHTYSRTKNLFRRFIKVLSPLNNLLIYKTFAAREYYDDAGSALTLSQSLKKSCYGDDEKDIIDFISKAENEDIILFIGAGDIYYIAKNLLKSDFNNYS